MCNSLVYLSFKNCTMKMVVVRKLNAKVKKLMHNLCLEDNINKLEVAH